MKQIFITESQLKYITSKNTILNESKRDEALSVYLPYFQERGINMNVSKLKQLLLAKFVNEGAMHNLSLGGNYYLLGVARYYFNGDLTTNKNLGIFNNENDNFNAEICTRLNALINILRNDYIDTIGTTFEQPEDFGTLKLPALLRKYNKKINEELGIIPNKEEKENIPQVSDSTEAGANYTYDILYSYEDARKYNKYTEPGAWCITYGKQHYDGYIKRLNIHYVIFLRKGYENVPRKIGKNYTSKKPQDEYGNSMIAVLQSNNSPEPIFITSRWNHGYEFGRCEADHAYTKEEFLNVIGCDESVLQRCYDQWKLNASQKSKIDRKALNKEKLNLLRDLKYKQMLINGGADPLSLFSSYRQLIEGIPNLFLIGYNDNYFLMDRKILKLDVIKDNQRYFYVESKYSNLLYVGVYGSKTAFYDLKRHEYLRFNGSLYVNHFNSYNDGQYVIAAQTENQLCLLDTINAKQIKAKNGDIWFEGIISLDNREYISNYSHFRIGSIQENAILRLIYDSASGEEYFFDTKKQTFITNELNNILSEGWVIEDFNYESLKVDDNNIGSRVITIKSTLDNIFIRKMINANSLQPLTFGNFNTFKHIKLVDAIVVMEPVDDNSIYFYNALKNKFVEFNGNILKTNGENRWGHLGINSVNEYGSNYVDENDNWYAIHTNYQREGNQTLIYSAYYDNFYNENGKYTFYYCGANDNSLQIGEYGVDRHIIPSPSKYFGEKQKYARVDENKIIITQNQLKNLIAESLKNILKWN